MLKKDLIKQVEQLQAKLQKEQDRPVGIVQDSNFYGVKYDEEFAYVARTIAEGFVANAEGLSKLADILSSSNVNIEAMVKIDGNQ